MELEGTVWNVLPPVRGTSARGEWVKQEVVFEQPGEFNRKVCVSFWGDKAQDAATLKPGEAVTISANVESREYNGRGVAVILNGTTTEQTFDTDRYAELFAGNANASTDGEGRIVVRTKDVTTGMPVVLRSGMRLPPRQTLILEY